MPTPYLPLLHITFIAFYFGNKEFQIFVQKYKKIFQACKKDIQASVTWNRLTPQSHGWACVAMNNKTNKIHRYSVHRVTATFTGACKQKHAISELGQRTCTVKLLRSSVMPLILSAWVKSEEWGWINRGWVGLWGSGGCGDAGACGDYEHMSLQPRPPQVLNVKCLTGRLSEEKLQRAVAPLEPGEGEVQRLPLAGWVFVSCFMAGSHCTAITGMLMHR